MFGAQAYWAVTSGFWPLAVILVLALGGFAFALACNWGTTQPHDLRAPQMNSCHPST